MIRRQTLSLHRSQQSISYYRQRGDGEDALGAESDYFSLLYPHMLIEDVALGIMPIGGRAEKRPFRVYLTPPNDQVQKIIAAAIGQRDYSHDFAGAVCDFFHDCAQLMIAYGEAVYEVVYLSAGEVASPEAFQLVLVQPHTLIHRRGAFVQYVPADIAREKRLPRYVRLPADRLLVFHPPAYVRRKLPQILDSLAFLSREVYPEFALRQLEGRSQAGFDSTAFMRSQKLALAEAGTLIGWSARSLLQEEMLEYYVLDRQLRFERFRIELRNNILAELNRGLTRAGEGIGFSACIEIEGLPTLADVAAARAALASGDRPFKDILDPFLGF